MDIIERMRAGEEVNCLDCGNADLVGAFNRAHALCEKLNTPGHTFEERFAILDELFGCSVDRACIINPPLYCDLGINVRLGKGVKINYGCVILDCAQVDIGDYAMIGPGVQIITPNHPSDHMARRNQATVARPVTIGEDAWIGAGATILPGVTVGARAIVAAGAVVTKDVPDDAVYGGVPAHDLHR